MIKRTFDIIFSLLVLIILFPILLIVVFLVKIESKGPVFFKQKRLGYKGSVFNLLKFRSMIFKPRNPNIQTLGGESDITFFGHIIRRLKIDEIPQLINVLMGDMSIVGPRPCLPELQKDFNEDGKKRLIVRPGLTGLAQIKGNIHISWEERWGFDRQYVEERSFYLDVKIIFLTVFIVIFGEKWGMKK